jgi:hypothetical protein
MALSGSFGISDRPAGVDFLSTEKGEICVVKSMFKGSPRAETPWMIVWYDQDTFEKIDSLVLKVVEQGRKTQVERVLAVNGKIFVLYSLIDQKHRTITLFARQLDTATRTLAPESKRICEITGISGERIRPGRFVFSIGPGRSGIFVLRSFSRDAKGHEVTSFALLDNALNLGWQKTIPLPYAAGLMRVENIKLSDDGRAFILVRMQSAGQMIAAYDILIAGNDGRSIKRFSVQTKAGFLSSVQIEVTNNRLLCMGFHNRTGGDGACGVFFNNIDVEKALSEGHTADFDPQFILRDLHPRDFAKVQAKTERGAEAELNQFVLDKIIAGKDGTFLLIGEQRYVYSIAPAGYRNTVYPRSSLRVSYSNYLEPSRNYGGDIVVVKLDSVGKILWQTKIHKSQDTNNSKRIFSSYMAFDIHGYLRILFNDDRRNVTEHATGREKDFGGSRPVVVIATVRDGGEVVRELIYDSVNAQVALSPAMSKQVSNNEIILYGYQFRHEQFSRINFK